MDSSDLNLAPLRRSLGRVPDGCWIVGVSGGADSIALLLALHEFRPDLRLAAAHFNHASRGDESDGDETFVVDLCRRLEVRCVTARLAAGSFQAIPNLEARFRQARLEWFREVITSYQAAGILLAQHADDRAETVLLRLLRDSDIGALDALRAESMVNGVRLVRPLLDLSREQLRAYLLDRSETWREDSSNRSTDFARNRIRLWLANNPQLKSSILKFADAAGTVRDWIIAESPAFSGDLPSHAVADLPDPVARHALRQWLHGKGLSVEQIPPTTIEQLLRLTRDRAAPQSLNLPGGRVARRQRDRVRVE